MKLENQVVSLDLAERLKDLGVEQESYFYWAECCGLVADVWHDDWTGEWADAHRFKKGPHFSAFTVAELGEMFEPLKRDGISSTIKPCGDIDGDGLWECGAISSGELMRFAASTEADARAKMLIYLIENGLLKP